MAKVAIVPPRPPKHGIYSFKSRLSVKCKKKKKKSAPGEEKIIPQTSTCLNIIPNTKLLLSGDKKEGSGANTATLPHSKSLKKVSAGGILWENDFFS